MKNNKSHSHCDIKRNKSAAIRDTSKWHSQPEDGRGKGCERGSWRVRQSRKDTSRAWKVRVTLRLRQRHGQAVRQMKGLRNGLRQELRQRQGYCAALWYRWLCCFYGIRQNDNNKYKHTH